MEGEEARKDFLKSREDAENESSGVNRHQVTWAKTFLILVLVISHDDWRHSAEMRGLVGVCPSSSLLQSPILKFLVDILQGGCLPCKK